MSKGETREVNHEVVCTIACDPDGNEALYGEHGAFITVPEWDVVEPEDYRAEGCTAVRHRAFKDDAPFFPEIDEEWEWPSLLPAEWLEPVS